MKSGHFFLQGRQLLIIKQIRFIPAAENQVNFLKGQLMQVDILNHAPERGNPRSGTDQKKFLIQICRKGKNPLGAAQRELAAHPDFLKQVIGAGSALGQYNQQFKSIRPVRPGGNAVTPPALIRLFVYGQVQRDKLTGQKVKAFQFGYLYSEPAGIMGVIVYFGYDAFSPGL